MRILKISGAVIFSFLWACTTLPEEEHKWYKFPEKNVFIGEPKLKYETLGVVREKIDFPTLDPSYDEQRLCKNYFNKGAIKLLEQAKKNGGDAVMGLRSVVYLMDGSSSEESKAECSDDGSVGQVLVKGIAIKWVKEPEAKN